MQQNAPFADVINHMILKYRELGILDVLWERWLHADNMCAAVSSGLSYHGLFIKR